MSTSVLANRGYFISLWRLAKSKAKRGSEETLRDCTELHAGAWQQDCLLHAYDGYGRLLGMAYWAQPSKPGAPVELSHFFSAPGHGRSMLLRLAAHLHAVGINAVYVPANVNRRGRAMSVDIARILGRLPPERASTPTQDLHPVLAGKAHEGEQEAAQCGAALHVMSLVSRLACNDIGTCVQLIERAKGAGHLRLVRDASQQPRGLLVWARPVADVQANGRIHASELNAGGDLLLLEQAALDADAVEGLVGLIGDELDADGSGLRIALQHQGKAQPELVAIARDDLTGFLRWFRGQLAAQASQLQALLRA